MDMASLALQVFEFGLHGAALVFLWLSFSLNKELNQQNPTEPPQIEVLKLKLRQLKFFMLLSLAFFLVGAALEIYQVQFKHPAPKIALITFLQPKAMPEGFPNIEARIDGRPLKFEVGRNVAELGQQANLEIDAASLRDAIVNMRSTLTGLQVAQVRAAPEVGLAADPAAGSVGLAADLASKSPEELQLIVTNLEARAARAAGPESAEERAAVKTSLGWVLFVQGDYAKAKSELEEAILLAKSDATRERARNNLSAVYLNEGQLDASESLLLQNPSSPFAQRNLEAIKRIRASAKAKLASDAANELGAFAATPAGEGP